MKKYKLYIDDVIDDLFFELESISDSDHGHEIVIEAFSKESAAKILCDRLCQFFANEFEEDKLCQLFKNGMEEQ